MHPDDILWWAKGGVLHGESAPRIAFLRAIVQEAPNLPLEPLNPRWDIWAASKGIGYHLYYHSDRRPVLQSICASTSICYQIDIIDTWNMTISTLPSTFSGDFRIELPGRPYIAVRMRAA
jgi:hypothetical protein